MAGGGGPCPPFIPRRWRFAPLLPRRAEGGDTVPRALRDRDRGGGAAPPSPGVPPYPPPHSFLCGGRLRSGASGRARRPLKGCARRRGPAVGLRGRSGRVSVRRLAAGTGARLARSFVTAIIIMSREPEIMESQVMWEPDTKRNTHMDRFRAAVASSCGLRLGERRAGAGGRALGAVLWLWGGWRGSASLGLALPRPSV